MPPHTPHKIGDTPSRAKVEIQTSRLLLREARESDAADLHKIYSDPEAMKYWSTLPHTSSTQTVEWLNKMREEPQNGILDFIIEYTVDAIPTVIGKIGIWNTILTAGEIGFLLSRDYWRSGIMTEALEAVLPYYFDGVSRFEKITADVDPENEASIYILKKFGFSQVGRRERTFEIGGVWHDSIDFELTRTAWKTRGEET
jgi:ribosomal-protein-alanine N-acetyltransferase